MNTNNISRTLSVWLVAAACLPLLAVAAHAQKGMGDNDGIVRQGLRPPLVKLSATVVSVETHPCEKTTGRAPAGAHVLAKAPDGTDYNLHLGPADVVAPITKPLSPGTQIEVVAFRTSSLPANHYIVRTLSVPNGKTVFHLRDSSLRPFWSRPGRLQTANQGPAPRGRTRHRAGRPLWGR